MSVLYNILYSVAIGEFCKIDGLVIIKMPNIYYSAFIKNGFPGTEYGHLIGVVHKYQPTIYG